MYWPGWLELLFALTLILTLLPLVPNYKFRYYICYMQYVGAISVVGTLLVPIFMFRPRNPINLVIAGNCLKHFTWFLGIEWDIRNGHILSNKEKGGSIIALNHQTIFDVMGLFNLWNVMGRATVIAKQELLWVLPFGPVAWLAGLIYINRNDPKTANIQIQEASKELFKDKIHLCVFPEGTRNKTGEKLLPFKNGAFRVALECQAPIIPVVFSPYYFIDSKNKCFYTGKVIISVLDPIETKGMKASDMDTLKQKTYQIMSDEYTKLGEEVKAHLKGLTN